MSDLETVKVHHPTDEGDYTIINKADFEESRHKLFDEQAKEQASKPPKQKDAPKKSNTANQANAPERAKEPEQPKE